MESLEYYKSLITENEVINALIKESKIREGEVEKSRVRPNLQFFQRTVTNLVSSNNRITVNQEKIRAKEKEKNTFNRPRKIVKRRKLHIDYINEILNNKIEFVKSSEGPIDNKRTSFGNKDGPSTRQNKTITCNKSGTESHRRLTNKLQISCSPNRHRGHDSDSSSSSDSKCSLKVKKLKKRRHSTSSYHSNNDNKSCLKSKKQCNNLSDNIVISLSSTSTDSESDNCIIIEDSS